jgi:hypothetical protein
VDSAQPDQPEFVESANDDGGVGDTLRPMEALDSDDVRNDDGDTVVDPPDHWSEADRVGEDRTLDDRLAEEVPDQAGAGGGVAPDDELERIDPEDTGTTAGQIDGTPEDGDSLFPIVE